MFIRLLRKVIFSLGRQRGYFSIHVAVRLLDVTSNANSTQYGPLLDPGDLHRLHQRSKLVNTWLPGQLLRYYAHYAAIMREGAAAQAIVIYWVVILFLQSILFNSWFCQKWQYPQLTCVSVVKNNSTRLLSTRQVQDVIIRTVSCYQVDVICSIYQ